MPLAPKRFRPNKNAKRLVVPYDDTRESAHKRGYTRTWSKFRRQFLREHPLCAECERHGVLMAASVVDHIVPVTDGQNDPNFWKPGNHQALCLSCHSKKTNRERNTMGRSQRVEKEYDGLRGFEDD